MKQYLSATCIVKDGGRRTLKDGKPKIGDLEIRFETLTTHIEFTTGGMDSMRRVVKTMTERKRTQNWVFLVGLERPTTRKRGKFGVSSNKRDTLALAAKAGGELRVFTLTNLAELEAWCMYRRLPYSHRTS